MVDLKHRTFGSMSPKPQDVEQEEVMSEIDLKSLIDLGCIKKDVQIDKLTFRIKSLSTDERRQLLDLSKQNKPVEEDKQQNEFVLSNVLLATVAMSIESVNGRPLESFYDGKEIDPTYQKMEIIAKMQLSVIAKLLDECNDVIQRSDSKFNPEQIKNL